MGGRPPDDRRPGPWMARCGPQGGGRGCRHARKRLRAFSLDNVTLARVRGPGGGCRCHSGDVARRCWRTTLPRRRVATGAAGARGWPRRPRTPPRTPCKGVRGVRGSTVGGAHTAHPRIRGSMRGSRMRRSSRLPRRVMASPLPRHRRLRPRRCQCRGWGCWVTSSGPGRCLPRSPRPAPPRPARPRRVGWCGA
jgi:hypothetical protein